MKFEIKNITCGYNDEAVVENLSVDIYAGEVLCMLGPNGVGKTTFFKTVMGFLPPIAGEIKLNGQDIRLWPKKKQARHLGYVPQAHIPPFPFNVLDVVTMGRTAYLGILASPSSADIEKSLHSLEVLGILHLKDRIYTELSGGERQMVLIARALTQNPDVLLMDEPTSNLDFGNQIRVLEQINALAERGLAVIMTSHVPDHAFLCSAKSALLCRRNLFRVGTAEEIVTEENLHLAYGVNVKIFDSYAENGSRIKSCIPVMSINNSKKKWKERAGLTSAAITASAY